MAHLLKSTLILTCLLTIVLKSLSFSPLEFLQHLQQQQFMQQQAIQQQQLKQQQLRQTPPPPKQQPTPQPQKPIDIVQPHETFKPFNGKCPLMIKGCFTKDNHLNNEDIPSFRIYFKGKETRSDKEGFFSINVDEERLDHYTLVLTKYPQASHHKHNTLRGLRILPNMNYKCFSYQQIGNQWITRETSLAKNNLMIPDDALVILIDPKYIDRLEAWNLSLNNNFIQLPKIVLKTEIQNKPIERASAKSLLSSLDATPFHEEVYQEVKKISDKVEIALAQ